MTAAQPQPQPPRLRLAVMTSGGDSAGMNACVRSVVKMAIYRSCHAYVVREGWEGLVRGNDGRGHAPPPPGMGARLSASSNDASPSGAASPSVGRHAATAAVLPGDARAIHDALAKAGNRASAPDDDATAPEGFVPTYGEGELLREGVGESVDRGLKGRYIVRVGWDDVRGWMDQGGTLIGTARSKSFRERWGRLRAAYNLISCGIDALAVCGGDGSLTGADRLRSEWPSLVQELLEKDDITAEQAQRHSHLKIVGLVGSIDNDMATTDMTIGAATALARICEAVDSISSTAASHSRAFVVEVMGRHCGWLALMAGIATGADYIFVPERPPPSRGDGWRDEMCEQLQRHRELGKRKTIVIVAEGALDRNLDPIRPDDIKACLTDRLGLDTRVTTLGHTQRGGKPVAADRVLATLQGVEAVEALLEASPDAPSYLVGIRENKIERVPLMHAVEMTQRVARAIEAKDFAAALALRDPEFEEGLRAFDVISQIDAGRLLPAAQRVTIGIMHVGAPAGGMNAATRTAVRYCLARGHAPLVVHNGFAGLLEDNVEALDWLRVDSWATRGGSELGTNRHLPELDLGGVAAKLQQHRVEALLLIGGFEAFVAVKQIDERRDHYPAFRIPVVALPATISNNVPASDFSLGADTSLNALVDACDAIKQSASASRDRVFVIETQGGRCGFIAVVGALAAGAVLVYTPEVGIGLRQLAEDVEFLKRRFRLDAKGKSEGRLVIRNERASDVFTTEVITKILKEEGDKLFDSRSASLGHLLQGGVPSPLDRTRATRLAMRCCEFLEAQALARRGGAGAAAGAAAHGHWAHDGAPATAATVKKAEGPTASASASASSSSSKSTQTQPTTTTACVMTIRGSRVELTPVSEIVAEADFKNRRGRSAWWHELKPLVELMGGRTGLGPA